MTKPYIKEVLKKATDEQKAELLAALADDLDVEIEAGADSGLDELGKALSSNPGAATRVDEDGAEPIENADDLAKALGGGELN